jgi:hypothetical protein
MNTNFTKNNMAKALLALVLSTLTGVHGNAAMASNSKVIGSVYGVQGRSVVKGWEKQLVNRNPGLEKFHWSPITAARPVNVIFRRSSASAAQTQPFRYNKPRVMSYNEMRLAQEAQQRRAQAQADAAARCNTRLAYRFNSRNNDVSARLAGNNGANGDVQGQIVSSYSGTENGYSSPYSNVSTYSNAAYGRSKVQGRLLSVK